MYRIVTAVAVVILFAGTVLHIHAQTAPPGLTIPAFTAYVEPDSDAMSVSERDGVTGWKDAAQKLVWYGYIKNPGILTPIISLYLWPPRRHQRR